MGVEDDVEGGSTAYAATLGKRARANSTASVQKNALPPEKPLLRLPPASGKRKHLAAFRNGHIAGGGKQPDRSAPRTRLSVEQKMEVLGELDKRVAQEKIADRFKCSVRTVQTIKQNRAALEGQASLVKGSRKSNRPAGFPEVRVCPGFMLCVFSFCFQLPKHSQAEDG